MLIEHQTIKMRWHPRNKEYYLSLGYIYTSMGDWFDVKIEDLPSQSHYSVKVQCDYCGNIIEIKWQNYMNRSHAIEKDACTKCKQLKASESVNKKYGVDNVFQLDNIKNKSKETNLKLYNCEYYSQTKECAEKVRQTCMDKYGVNSYSQTEECKNKIKQTCQEKYNADFYCMTKEFKDKSINSCLEKYNVPYYTQTEEYKKRAFETFKLKYGGIGHGSKIIKEKIIKSYYNKQTCATSKPQLLLNELLIETYGNSLLNFPCGCYNLDCMIEIGETKIDVEYDGQYWHKNKEKQDYNRDCYVHKQGYKILRILGNNTIPTKEEIIQAVDYLVKGNHQFIKITTDIK